MGEVITDGAVWRPWYLRRADFSGITLLLVDADQLCAHGHETRDKDIRRTFANYARHMEQQHGEGDQ